MCVCVWRPAHTQIYIIVCANTNYRIRNVDYYVRIIEHSSAVPCRRWQVVSKKLAIIIQISIYI